MKMTKTALTVLMAMILLLGCIVPASAAQYVTIADIREETKDGWHETYTYKGEEIRVDADIEIPDVDKIPIIRVVLPLDMKATHAPENAEINDEYFEGSGILYTVESTPHVLPNTAKESKKKNGWDSYGEPGFQAEYSPLSPDDAVNIIISKLVPYSEQVGTLVFNQNYVVANSRTYERISRDEKTGIELLDYEKPLTTMGFYDINLHQSFYGVSFFRAYPSYEHPVQNEHHAASVQGMVAGTVATENDYYLMFSPVIEERVLVADAPLTSFASIKSVIEKLITDGYVRRVVSVRLGYILMNDPDALGNRYILVPTWDVSGSVVVNPKAPTPTLSYTDKYMQDIGNVQFIQINAQIGKYYDINDTNPNRSNASYISWDEVK